MLDDKILTAIKCLRHFNDPERPLFGGFSGGKDSCVIKELAKLAEVPVAWHYNKTTIDAPELLAFIKKHHPDVIWDRPKHGNFFNRAAKVKGFPTRLVRWCCAEYKECQTPDNVTLVLGVRAAESPRRAKNWKQLTKNRKRKNVWVLNPILDWSDEDVWGFIHSRKLPYCGLYDEGFTRLGCVGCPMAGNLRIKQFARWPQFETKWKQMFHAVWDRRSGTLQADGRKWFGDRYFHDWQEMWDWWLSNKKLPGELEDLDDNGDDEDVCQTVIEFLT